VYQINKRVGLMKVIIIDTNTDIQRAISDAETPNNERKVVFEYIMSEMRGVYLSSDGIDITISARTAKKCTSHATEIKLRAITKLDEMLTHCEFDEIVEAKHKRYSKFIYYKTNFEIDGKRYSAIINVGITNGDKAVLYDFNQIKEQ